MSELENMLSVVKQGDVAEVWVSSPAVTKIVAMYDSLSDLRAAAATTKKGKRELRKWLLAVAKLCGEARKEISALNT
jgi:hypothetical protein